MNYSQLYSVRGYCFLAVYCAIMREEGPLLTNNDPSLAEEVRLQSLWGRGGGILNLDSAL